MLKGVRQLLSFFRKDYMIIKKEYYISSSRNYFAVPTSYRMRNLTLDETEERSMKRCRLMISALLVLLLLLLAACAYAADVCPLEIDPAKTDLDNGRFCLAVTDEDRIEDGGYFTALLYLEDRYDAGQIKALAPGDTVQMNGAVFTVKEIVIHEADHPGEEDTYEVYPEEEYYGYLVFFPNADGTFSALIDDWVPVTPVGEIRVMLPLPDRFTYISITAGEEDEPANADAFLDDLDMFGGFVPWNTSCVIEDGILVNITHASYPWGPEEYWPGEAEESSGEIPVWQFCHGDYSLLETAVISGSTLDCEAGPIPYEITGEEAEELRTLAMYGVVTGRENDEMVTGGTWLYTFETPEGEYIMTVELYRGLLVGSDGMYAFEIRRNGGE